MIDYHANQAALEGFTAALSSAVFPDGRTLDAQHAGLAALSAEPGAALLGAFVQHLIGHAASNGVETALLQQAAELWTRGVDQCTELGRIRAALEGAIENPGEPGAAEQFNAAAVDAQNFANTVNSMRTEVDALRGKVLEFSHLPPHPRQLDRRTDTWDWANLSLGRRTDALVRSLFRHATNPRTLAFATGATASYGANVAGSAYLGHVVGGPRRLHRFRDRIARNAVGSWIAAHHPSSATPTAMARSIMLGMPANAALPSDLETLIKDALSDTFDLARTPPLPDIQLGYQRLVTHLNLLDRFVRPASPAPPGQTWMAKLYGDPQNPPGSLRPQDVDVTGQDGGGVAVQYGNDPSPGSSAPSGSDSSKMAKGCGIAFLAILLLDLVQAFVQCIGQWANKHRCTFWDNMLLSKLFEQDPPDPRGANQPENSNVTASQLTALGNAPEATQLVGFLFDAHNMLWEALDKAYVFLAATGLIYPGDLTPMPLYAQFVSVPASQPWPHREVQDAAGEYHLYPNSLLENPVASPSPFPPGALPDILLSFNSELIATNISLGLWRQIPNDEHDSENRDLDADRGAAHLCWAAQGSVLTDPLTVVNLAYSEQ